MIEKLPAVNAGLNALSTVLLVLGFIFIKRREIARHKACMIAAVISSAAFLCCYLVYHAEVGSVKYQGTGVLRMIYFAVLVPHIILAALMVPPILFLLWHAWKGDFERHKRVARWTLPVWLYVSVTGIIVYLMLYVF